MATAALLLLGLSLAACGTSTKPLPTPTVAGTLAFTQLRSNNQDDTFLMRTDGTGLRRLTDSHGSAEAPAWSPDGRMIALHRAESTNSISQLWVMKADGSQPRQLTSDAVGAAFAAWSPDGQQIAFSSFLTPDGTKIAHIYVINADGSGRRQLTRGAENDIFADWSPDGRIFFLRKEGRYDSYDGDVYAVRPDGSGLVRVTTLGHVGGFALSPDGTTLAIHDTAQTRIVLLPLAGGQTPRSLVNTDFGYQFVQPAWSPDGKALALSHALLYSPGSFVAHRSAIHIVNADGSGLSEVPGDEGALGAVWRPQ